jgi:hypothetical protein
MSNQQETEEENFVNKINSFTNDYYNNSSKNFFFKKSQKIDCANKISTTFDIDQLIQKTCFIIPNKSCVYFDYSFFKLYANESNYEKIIDRILDLFDDCILTNNELKFYVNLEGFTVSAAERYKKIILLFFNRCADDKRNIYSEKLSYWKILNTPLMIDMIKTIIKPLIPSYILSKVIIVSKKDTPLCLHEVGLL